MAKAVTKSVNPKVAEAVPFYKKHPFELVVVLFTLLLFSNSLFNDYNLDDELVTRNHRLTSKGISAIPEIFTSPYYQDAMGYAYEYRPVPLATFAIEHSLFGDKAGVSHFFNLVLYALLCLCLFRLLVSIGGQITPFAALCITLLFSAHTSHTEVVCSIKNRDEILGLLFCVTSMQSAISAARKTSWWRIGLAAALFLLAMLCKSTFLPFAFLIPLALILFTQGSLLLVIALTALLAAVSYAVLDVNPPYFKLWLVVMLLIGVAATHLFVKNSISVSSIRAFLTSNKTASSNPDVPFSGLKDWLAEFNIHSLFSLLIAVVVLLVYVYGCMNTGWSLIFISALLLGSLLLDYKKFAYWDLSSGLLIATACIGIEMVNYTKPFIPIAIDYSAQVQPFYLLYCFCFFWGKNTVRLPALLLLPFITYYLGTTGQMGDLIATLLLFSLSRIVWGRKILLAVIVVLPVFLADSILAKFNSQTIGFVEVTPAMLLLSALFMFNWRNSWMFLVKRINWIMAGLTIVLSISFANHFQHDVVYNIQTSKDYVNLVKTVVEKKTDRPLNYVEYPLPVGAPIGLRIGTSLVVLGHYLSKTILPYPLSFYYGYSFIAPTGVKNVVPILVFLLYLSILLAALFLIRRNKHFAFGLLVFFLSTVMFSGYILPVPGIVADRYLLVPSLGWSIVLVLLLFKLWKVKSTNLSLAQISHLPKGFAYSLTGILCFYSVLTFSRNLDWKNDLQLFRHDIKYVSNSAQAHNLLALHLMKQSYDITDPALLQQTKMEALGHFKDALQLYPSFYNVAFDIGRTFSTLNMPDSAIVYFQRAIAINPKNSDAHVIVARLLNERNRLTEAVPYYEYRIKNVPTDYPAYEALSFIHYTLKDYGRSMAVNHLAINQFPTMPDPLINIGRTYFAMNKTDSARIYFQRGLLVSPNNPKIIELLQQVSGK